MSSQDNGIYVDPNKTRTSEQLEEYERIFCDGICPFCVKYRDQYTQGERLLEGSAWWVFQNQWPYPNTKHQLMSVPKQHCESLADIDVASIPEWLRMYQQLVSRFNIHQGIIAARFGFVLWTGSSVAHFHTHLITMQKMNLNDQPSLGAGEIILSTDYWSVHESCDASEFSHRLIIQHRTPGKIFEELSPDDAVDLFNLMKHLEHEYDVDAGGFAIRFHKESSVQVEFVIPDAETRDDESKSVRILIDSETNLEFKVSCY